MIPCWYYIKILKITRKFKDIWKSILLYYQDSLEYFLFEKLLTQIYKGTKLELEYTLKNNFAFFILFEEEDE